MIERILTALAFKILEWLAKRAEAEILANKRELATKRKTKEAVKGLDNAKTKKERIDAALNLLNG